MHIMSSKRSLSSNLPETINPDTKSYLRSHHYLPGWHVVCWRLVLRALIIRTVMYFLDFAPRRRVRKDVECPSQLLSYAARDTFLPINTFVLPFSLLLPFLRNYWSYGSVFEWHLPAQWLPTFFCFKLSTFAKVCSLFFCLMILCFCSNAWL